MKPRNLRLSLCLATLLCAQPLAAQEPATTAPAPTQLAAPAMDVVPPSQAAIQFSFAPIVKKTSPSVVNIYTKRVVVGRMANPFMNDPFFAPFFSQMGAARTRVENALGSGFIIDASGLIVTNAHVIKDAQEIAVVMSDGREYEAKTVLVDTPSDLGLLRIDPTGAQLPALTLATTDSLDVGDLVIAIGNPFGVGQTVTSGIVSALARSNTNINDFDFFIQTDAAINPGNSGGPLVGMDGRVVGVNSAIFSKSGGSLGIGFAIPADMVKAVLEAEKNGQISGRGVLRPWLGFKAQSLTSDMAQSLGQTSPHGALVAEVVEDGPADKAGLKAGDLITAINNKPIKDAEELRFRIATLPLGQNADLRVARKGSERVLVFTASPPPEIPPRDTIVLKGDHPLFGATIINLSPAVADEMGIAGVEKGVVIQTVAPGSFAARMGFMAGDTIVAIGNRSIQNTRQLQDVLNEPQPQNSWAITFSRNGNSQTIILR